MLSDIHTGHWMLVSLNISPCCCLMFTPATEFFYTFMFRLLVNLETALWFCLLFTLVTVVFVTFVFRLLVNLETALWFCLIFTLVAGIFYTFMDGLLVSLKTLLSCCWVFTRVTYFIIFLFYVQSVFLLWTLSRYSTNSHFETAHWNYVQQDDCTNHEW